VYGNYEPFPEHLNVFALKAERAGAAFAAVIDVEEAHRILSAGRAAALGRRRASSHDPNTRAVPSGRKDPMVGVLCLCVHNSARSQMAAAYFRRFGADLVAVESAGLEPGVLNPLVVCALAEDGIDISGKATQDVFSLCRAGRTYRYVITVCSREAAERCPIFPGRSEKLLWPFPDPSTFTGTDDEKMAQVRTVRDAIRAKVKEFVDGLRATGTA
jgi:arsenate reductase